MEIYQWPSLILTHTGIGVFVLFQKNKIVTNLDLINGSDGSLDFNGGHHFEGFLDGGRAHLFVAESDGGA